MTIEQKDRGLGDYPNKIKTVLKKLNYPEYVWRERIIQELYPLNKYMTRHEGNGYKTARRAVTICMSDATLLGYVRDGGNSHNPRFKKAKSEE